MFIAPYATDVHRPRTVSLSIAPTSQLIANEGISKLNAQPCALNKRAMSQTEQVGGDYFWIKGKFCSDSYPGAIRTTVTGIGWSDSSNEKSFQRMSQVPRLFLPQNPLTV